MAHCHERDCPAQHGRTGPLILIGDAFHNFVDGVVIAAVFFVSVPLGIATSVAVIAHEVPQEVGDFAILLESGYGHARVFWLLTCCRPPQRCPGLWLAISGWPKYRGAIPNILALSAASFIYIALADLVPSLHRRTTPWQSTLQLALLLAGIGTIGWMHYSA